MSMHTTQEWHQHAHFNMYQAQHTHRKADRQQDASRKTHEDVTAENLTMYSELHSTLDQKVKISYRLVEKIQQRAESLDQSVKKTKQSHSDLEQALHDKEAPLSLCMWRMEQRERRPLREQVRDTVEVAMEVEKATLIDAQRKLKDSVRRTRACIQALEGKLEELKTDIQQKAQALSVDEMCLRTTTRSFQSVADKTASSAGFSRVSPSSVVSRRSTRHDVATHESSRNEVQRQQEAVRLNQSAVSREEAAKELRDDNAKLISRCEQASVQATAKSEKAMKERINENQGMRRRLEMELRETHNTINDTKSTISQTKSQIRSLEEPMELCSTCASWRKQRATREHILDPVTTTLQEHQMSLLKAHEELRSHHKSEKTVLQDLQERQERLKDDLRDKTAALHIDLNCLTHEATHMNGKPGKVISKNRLPRALKVDPSFVPSPGHTFKVGPMTAR
mmetsp:Transcript_96675/g.174591  ORF Transcript_96675/g.174591 Transcript_96675/m.174591 type:complete len:452 (-) Transcript_96675:244-1599(-)